MTSPASRISDEIVERAIAALSAADYDGQPEDESMRAAIEAVWPEPTFTPEETKALLEAVEMYPTAEEQLAEADISYESAQQVAASIDKTRATLAMCGRKLKALRDE